MTKNFFGGATINSGPTLPLIAETPDGSLFYKTSAPSGLYYYGFNPDANGGLLGDQSTQGWTMLVDTSGAQPYVLKTGDVMTGGLNLSILNSDAFFASGENFLTLFNGAANPAGWYGVQFRKSNGNAHAAINEVGATFGTGALAFGVAIGGVLTNVAQITGSGMSILGNTVWHGGNDGAGSSLDADLLDGLQGSYYLDINNSTGILPVARGGTGSSAGLVTGGVLYGSSPSLVATTSAGSAGQLFRSNGGGAPSWIDASTLSVASAVTANFASTAGSATSAGSVPWTGVTGLGNFGTSLQVFSAYPTAISSTRARPSYFFDMGNTGALSMRPNEFPEYSISGFAAYNTSDMGQFQAGLTVIGGTSGAYALQISANWNFEEGTPTGLRYRVNDDTSDLTSWSNFQTLWDSGNFNPGNYVAKSGDTMTGGLFVPSIAVGSVSMPATGGINTSGNITAFGFISSLSNITSNGGNFITSTGYMQSGNNSGSTGYTRLFPSGSGNSGYLEFYPGNNIRAGYIGNSGATGSQDGGGINYVSGFHAFNGNMTVTGNIVAQGNITAFSDRRLKSNIAPITDALYKVQRLEGVTFNRKGTEERATGLIAQDVEAVLPEAVVTDTDGMKSVAYGNMVGLLVEAIKEQQEQIAMLRDQIRMLVR